MSENQFDAAVDFQLDAMRVSARTKAEVDSILRKMERELVGKLAGSRLTDWSRARIKQQLTEVRAVIGDSYGKAELAAIDATETVATVGAKATVAGIKLGGAEVLMPTAAYLETIAGNAIVQGAVQAEWWAKQSADTAFRFSGAVRQGLAAAETNQQIVQRVRQVMDVSRANAATLVQTSVATVANDARQAVFDANADIIKRYRAIATLDSIVCFQCAPLDGKEWLPDGTPIGHSYPMPRYPLHHNCLVGESLITACDDITGISKRWFDGEVVVIKTAAGRELTCTPNHPILTGSGWIAAGLLNVGGNVISNRLGQGEGLVNGDHEDMPTSIHDRVESFLSARKVVAVPVPVTASDFHGDGKGSKIAVVYSDSFLADGFYPSTPEHVCEDSLILRTSDISSSLFGAGSGFQFAGVPNSATDSIMGFFGQSKSLFFGGSGHSGKLLGASIPSSDTNLHECSNHCASAMPHNLGNACNPDARVVMLDSGVSVDNCFARCADSIFFENADHDMAGYSELAANILQGGAGSVFVDDIVGVEIRNFSGHVYNLETQKGWYVANGIITHNCRCLRMPIVIDGPRGGKRAAAGGPVDANLTFSGWLERQPKAKQDEMLGKGRADLYRAGKITLNDLTNGAGRPLTLEQLRKKYD